ncbi:MAG: TetR/AcrR family transcriptional regulator [Spirochaetaceae bacterium]|jgi:AcrR family transcriptional regulator|nr:TetR/AcrR family transcriptional regulator [Spirochaetaceae bacterium]
MQVKKDKVRKSILREAGKLFIENGYENMSMRDLSKNIGMSLGNAYRYFPSKEDIFNEVINGIELNTDSAISNPVLFCLILEKKYQGKFIKRISTLDPEVLVSLI